jgi:hypothetical protein
MNNLPKDYPFGMTGKQLDEQDSIVEFNPHVYDGELLPCDFCQTKTPEPILDENRVDGQRLCEECYTEYCSTPDID